MAERPDTDTDWLTLAEYFVEWADSVDPLWQGGFCSDNDALRERAMNARAAADGLRQYAAITAERDQLRAAIDRAVNLDRLRAWAADRGVTDGETSVVDAYEASHNRHMGRPH